jgi:GNAT superfamily N-acetyltransferase
LREGRFVDDFADYQLAERLERFAAADVRGLAEAVASLFPDSGGRVVEVGGGVAGFVGPASPANGAIGLGFRGEVTQGQIAKIERFFLDLGEEPIISVCPLAHPSLIATLSQRGWRVGAFENVLVRAVGSTDTFDSPNAGVEVREACGDEDMATWAVMAARGFAAPGEPSQADLRLATAATKRDAARFLFGLVEGAYAGTGQVEIDGEVGWLSADTTLPEFRRRGVQSTLQRARLELARDAGCALAVTESVPGSPSQRNMERLGFQVAYTRIDARYASPRQPGTPKGTDT